MSLWLSIKREDGLVEGAQQKSESSGLEDEQVRAGKGGLGKASLWGSLELLWFLFGVAVEEY